MRVCGNTLTRSNMNKSVQPSHDFRPLIVADLDVFPLRRSPGSIEPLVENPTDGSLLMLVPGGGFLVGGPDDDEGGVAPFPVSLPPYYLAMYPVTNMQYARFLTHCQPDEWDLQKWIASSTCIERRSRRRYEADEATNDHPVQWVTWWGAEAYCQWAGVRLPTELEWEKGARGVDGRAYPWGQEWDASKCRNSTNTGSHETCTVWSYPEGCSYWGHYQMSGNVWEWCSSVWDSEAYARYKGGDLTPASDSTSGRRVVRGGSCGFEHPGSFRCALRVCDHADYYCENYGFRVAKSATP
jgi:formylglycine-generating enzyme